MSCAVNIRIGNGYDVHRLVEGRSLIIGGVLIPFEKGLLGHSDADVLCHAVTDAVLGAAALGDIGRLFPDSESAYKGISSLLLLERAVKMCGDSGFYVINVDSVIIAENPKMSPYISEMRERIAKALGVSVSCVSVKATTEEGLGVSGEGLGIAAQAVCLIERR